jgi:tellurium resistance protein TerD
MSNPISLKKGESINLRKKAAAVSKIMIGLGWEVRSGGVLDIDVSVFMVNTHQKLPKSECLIFYNNLKSPDGAVQHTGHNRTGQGDGDDEMILANLPLIAPEITELIFVVSIYEAAEKRQHFGLLKEAYIRIVDVATQQGLVNFDLDEEFGFYTDIEFGRLQRINNEWYFKATGIGGKSGLQSYVDKYI